MKLALPSSIALVLILSTVCSIELADDKKAYAIAPENVLVIYSDDQGPASDGYLIAEHYQQLYPGVHLAPISGVDAILDGPLNEEVDAQDYLDVIRPQIQSAISAIPDTIDVIVSTKGMPLRLDAGPNPSPGLYPNWESHSSFESELTRIDLIDTVEEMGNQKYWDFLPPPYDSSLPSNPYFNSGTPFAHVGSGTPFDIRLSTRLDAYSAQSAIAALDRAQNVFVVPHGHYIVTDDDPDGGSDQIINGPGDGPGLFEVVTGRYPDDGMTNPVPLLYDNTDEAIVSCDRPVLGYVSHGIHDGSGGLSSNYLGQFVGEQFVANDIQFSFANGAIFQSYESFNAQSFDPTNSQNQGLIADWLELGGTAGLGHVAEPGLSEDTVTNEDIFYQMLLPAAGAAAAPGESGLTFVEAAWNATRQLSYVNTVVGDPLMTIKAWLPGDANLDGKVNLDDFFILQHHWEEMIPHTFDKGDFNGDGFVDDEDFDILAANWMMDINSTPTAAPVAAPVSEEAGIVISPVIDTLSGLPDLLAISTAAANFDGDIDVDGDDLAVWAASLGVDDGGDADGDGDTDGADFLIWQRQFAPYTLTADFDFSAAVDAVDLAIWKDSFGRSLGGDADGDGDTDGTDFLALQRQLAGFAGLAAAATSASVPEPSSLCLTAWLITVAMIGARRPRYSLTAHGR